MSSGCAFHFSTLTVLEKNVIFYLKSVYYASCYSLFLITITSKHKYFALHRWFRHKIQKCYSKRTIMKRCQRHGKLKFYCTGNSIQKRIDISVQKCRKLEKKGLSGEGEVLNRIAALLHILDCLCKCCINKNPVPMKQR